MKKVYFTAVIAMAFFLTNTIQAQKFEQLDKSPTDISYLRHKNIAKPLIKVVYSRPQKEKGAIFGKEIPYGKIWQTGANEATEVKFYTDMMFGNKVIKAGTYVMHTIPGEKEWTIILNNNTDTWGAYFYDETKDVARIKVPVKKMEELDVFSIAFKQDYKNTFMVLAWDTTRVDIPLKTNDAILAEI